eukprot:CAMPEP_0170644062 /NCGR_PEP_ID=MMETSP0224-20130122/42261_1 /TAXON_ID=285029 /ORGANISM="Togula jolla, Strain CCCM 725" /LENGTH=123 /DNA_ID=CAMNT_0010975017 /DNA_START=281 /DNA_END=649 /DNA_ORIENTATION=+
MTVSCSYKDAASQFRSQTDDACRDHHCARQDKHHRVPPHQTLIEGAGFLCVLDLIHGSDNNQKVSLQRYGKYEALPYKPCQERREVQVKILRSARSRNETPQSRQSSPVAWVLSAGYRCDVLP